MSVFLLEGIMDVLMEKLNELSKRFIKHKAEDRRFCLRKLENDNIYFIQQGYDGPIKIGLSKTPFARINELQPGNPYDLRLLFYYKPDYDLTIQQMEHFLHKRFAKYQVNKEWFFPTDEILSFIEEEIRLEFKKLGILVGTHKI
jgi:hypothetical protein